MTTKTNRATAATRTAVTTLAVGVMLVIALTDGVVSNARTTWRDRHNDKGEILDWVVVAAGVVSLAVIAIAWVRPFVMRKLNEIQ